MPKGGLAFAFLLLTTAGCATKPREPANAPVVLLERCPVGPYCITGQIDDQFASAVPDVRCVARVPDGHVVHATSDRRGVFLVDQLSALPREIRCEKAGYDGQDVPILSGTPNSAARAYVTLHRTHESDCWCDPTTMMSGQPPCPPDRCPPAR